MFGLTVLGSIHTLIGLVAVLAGTAALLSKGRILPDSLLGKTYIGLTVLTCLSAFGIYQRGAFGDGHVLAVLTLAVLLAVMVIRQTGLGLGFSFLLWVLLMDRDRRGRWLGFGLVLVGVMTLFLFRTRAGFAQQVGGLAPAAARYAGFSSRKALWLALGVSGALAGLAGALEVAGPVGQLTPHIPVGYGFAAIIVAFVGRLHPVGIVFSAVLMSLFYIGGELAQSRMGLPKSINGVFQGLLLFALLACDTLIHYRLVWRRKGA